MLKKHIVQGKARWLSCEFRRACCCYESWLNNGQRNNKYLSKIMFDNVQKQNLYTDSWMDDVATKYANKVTENKKTIIWVEFWRIAYFEKMEELRAGAKKVG